MRGRRLAVMGVLVAMVAILPATAAMAGDGDWPVPAGGPPVTINGDGNWPL